MRELADAVPYGSEGWAKARRPAANFLVLAASTTAVTLPSLPERDSLTATIQRADAEVADVTVVEQPRIIRKRDNDDHRDRVAGYVVLPWVFLFALGPEGETLRELAWSPGAQSVHTLIILCAAHGYTSALTGHPAHGLQALFQAGGWLLMPAAPG
ncbi:hypothetical protein [Streptomyces syringium]|uniref:hypothetical protein n=1 Tax=Streptomyces syringium TaxID=76729 RepID=UPI0034527668